MREVGSYGWKAAGGAQAEPTHRHHRHHCSPLKQYRAIATRYDKTARNFLAAIHLAAAIICLN